MAESGQRRAVLELQSCFAGCVGQSLDPSVIDVAATVEDHFADALGFGTLGNGFADDFCRRHVAAGAPVFLFAFGGARRNQRLAVQVVDQLYINMVERTVHVEPRTFRCALHLFPDAVMHVPALMIFRDSCQHKICPWRFVVGRSPKTPTPSKTCCRLYALANNQRPTAVTWLPSFRPSSSAVPRHSARLCFYTDRGDAARASPRRPVRLSGGQFR